MHTASQAQAAPKTRQGLCQVKHKLRGWPRKTHTVSAPTVPSTMINARSPAAVMLGKCPIYWMRIDPTAEWLAPAVVQQPPHMWGHQLLRSREVCRHLWLENVYKVARNVQAG